MTTVLLRREGDAIGLTLPAEMSTRLGLEPGQELTVVELADGVKLIKRNPALERQMALAGEVLVEQAEALRELARR
ncbi:MAG TPA: AbrB/MazE/SpoVT family DNA-binding domain-containing protein [Acetobacteraceae bacterium]|nr:AbrB/MazE/SpoVT family DNA-binding domain-containing protein [Acetobacteraceae bacterium]